MIIVSNLLESVFFYNLQISPNGLLRHKQCHRFLPFCDASSLNIVFAIPSMHLLLVGCSNPEIKIYPTDHDHKVGHFMPKDEKQRIKLS